MSNSVIDITATVSAEMTKSCARDLTDRIKAAGTELYDMLWRAHQGKAWKALGYSTWKEYLATELDMSKSRSFQILNFVEARRLIAESTTVDLPTNESQTRPLSKLKTGSDKLTAWTHAIRSTKGHPTTAAVEASVEKIMRESPRYSTPHKPIEKSVGHSVAKEKIPDTTGDQDASSSLLTASRATGIGPHMIRLVRKIKEVSPDTFERLKNGDIEYVQAADETGLTDMLHAAPEVRIYRALSDALLDEHGDNFESHLTKEVRSRMWNDASNLVLTWMTAAYISVEKGVPIE